MKSRRDCDCACHRGGIMFHMVPCCDGLPVSVRLMQTAKKKAQALHKKARGKHGKMPGK